MTSFLARLLLFGLFLLPALARAQTTPADTVSASPAAADTTDVPAVAPAAGGAAGQPSTEFENYNLSGTGIRYTASLTGLYSSGTAERTFIATSHTANFAFGGGRLRLPTAFSYSYGRQDGLLREREILFVATPSLRLSKRLRLYALTEASRSNLRAIDRRLINGAGAGYTLYQDTLQNELGLSYFLLYEDTRYLTELHREVLRHSLRLKAQAAVGPALFSGLLYYQPAVADARDYRLSATAALSVRLYQRLAFTLAYAYSFEKVSVADRASQNTNLSAGLTFSTGR